MQLRQSHWVTHSRAHCNCSTHKIFSVLISRFLIAASNGELPFYSVLELYPASTTSFILLTTVALNWLNQSLKKSKLCYDGRSIGQYVLVSSRHLGPKTRFLLLSDSCGFVDAGLPLWWEDMSDVYNFCWASPAQLFPGPYPTGLMTIFCCLNFWDSPDQEGRCAYLCPPGIGWPIYPPRHWVPFPWPLLLRNYGRGIREWLLNQPLNS
jgi:hypothetical protein